MACNSSVYWYGVTLPCALLISIAVLALVHLVNVLIKDDSSYMGWLLCCRCAVCRGCNVSQLAQFTAEKQC